MRVGTGYDSHRFSESRPMVLGGVSIPDTPGLEGHSDGDAILHAVTDALLGAGALGSIGDLFPDTDPRWEGADSADLLSTVVDLLEDHGFRVVNADVTVIAEAPRIRPHSAAIARRLSSLLRVDPSVVGVKGKTNEGMGWIGRKEGLAVIATVLIDSDSDGAGAAPGT